MDSSNETRVDIESFRKLFGEPRPTQGRLISIVGFDGSGKTTQIEQTASALRRQGHEVVETKQPTDWYRQLSKVQSFHAEGGSVETAHILALLAAADRRQHVREVIEPALERGAIVLCDRYVYATFGVFIHRGVDSEFLATINSGIPRPDYAFYLDMSSADLVRRLKERDGENLQHEEKSVDRIESITRTYKELASELISIDGSAPPTDVTAAILSHLQIGPPTTENSTDHGLSANA
ncbi:dTMP kinase [Natronoglycomyces albus]|uniref:Thymidylate kinase n=1 Tax=Natronoglycomyces albus TaxID=2811108 RepID=A0A895XQ04_9ACTN|nr:dTMP kinase [Natronoglycomyces albus]QSB05195.1 dTMP kinase [Natronoglycomyces albus]